MPRLFYPAAYHAACHDAPPQQIKRLTDAHFETTVEKLEEALAWLTPEQLCDALYGDWLLHLHNPGGEVQLQLRSLLIGQGALAANYLAELAQNADDAYDGKGDAEVRLAVDGNWLLVANNGRRVTPGNLRGLSRFFVHRGGKIRELDAATIGRFGIGFKSCYRIASEVLVQSWSARDQIVFRLPISKTEDPHSLPDDERLQRVTKRLSSQGAPVSQDILTPDKLGYCTPEFRTELPPDLARVATALQKDFDTGTLFAFHLHELGESEVRKRVSGQEHELYELCPLFLPKMRKVRIGDNELTMHVTREDPADGLGGRVKAVRVRLETTRAGKVTRDRFWKLTGTADGDRWQMALHADSNDRLNFKNDDESVFSLREGGAYAFFPLNDANRDFLFRFHLHIDLPTDLKRGDWNDQEAGNVRSQIGRAVDAFAEWLEAHRDKRHPDWQIEGLFRAEPREGAVWSHEIFKHLKHAVNERPLLRTLWGDWRRGSEALAVRLSPASVVRRAWESLCSESAHVGNGFPFVYTIEHIDLGIPPAGADQLRSFFAEAAAHPAPNAAYWRNMLHSILGVEGLTLKSIEDALGRVKVEQANGGTVSVAQLMQRTDGAELSEEWHAAFRSAAAWIGDDDRRTMSVFGEPLLKKLQRLGAACFSVEWDELPSTLATLDDWIAHGDEFWARARPNCPPELRRKAAESLRVKHGRDLWQSVAEVWLVDSSPVRCFHGVIRPWDRGTATNNEAQTKARTRLQNWGLWDEYLSAVERRLEEKLAARLLNPSGENGEVRLSALCDEGHRNSLAALPQRWQDIVSRAERKALKAFLASNHPPLAGMVCLSTSNAEIPFEIRRVLAHLLRGFVEAPSWLNARTWALIVQHGLAEIAGFSYLDKITAERRVELAQAILEQFWKWKEDPPMDERAFSALETLFAEARGTWSVRLAANKNAILNQLFVRTQDGQARASAEAFECAMSSAGKPMWHIDFLPEPLTRISRITAVCLGPESLRLEPVGEGISVSKGRVHPDILAAPGVESLLASREWRFEFLSPLNLLWKAQGTLVCEIRDAAFVFDSGRFLVSRLTATIEQDQYREILVTYKQFASDDEAFRVALKAGKPPHEVYLAFRTQILRVLRERLVEDEGYKERHILRELLQNAESAYASRSGGRMEKCSFHARSEFAGSNVCVTVMHHGRAFNETDSSGNPRPDIARIVGLRAANQNAPDEIGRFNRGFKSVFTLTDRVSVQSGAYNFEIEDLLILHPPEPEPQTVLIPETRFTFECSRSDAHKLFGTTGGGDFSVFHAASFVFLKYVDEITLEHGGSSRCWRLRRTESETQGWSTIVVEEPGSGQVEHFLVHCGVSPSSNRRYGAAIRSTREGTPRELEPAWNKLCLTFPTETHGPFGFLVNGDFDIDGGRVTVTHSKVNESLLKESLSAIREYLLGRVQAGMSRAEWLGWARVLQVRKAIEWIESNFPADSLNLIALVRECGAALLRKVPHHSKHLPLNEVVVPTRLLRDLLVSEWGKSWGIEGGDWLDLEIEKEVLSIDAEAGERRSLRDFARTARSDSSRAQQILTDLQSPYFTQQINPNAPAQNEIRDSISLLQPSLSAETVLVQTGFDFRILTAAEVIKWWRDNDDPDDYTLDSAVLWPLFGPADLGAEERKARLVASLSAPATAEGKRLWYQVLGFACLMSAGWPMDRVLRFWKEKLEEANFWENTGAGFEAADGVFEKVIHEEIHGANASGEDATFWRRIFYDVRKVRHLIYENQFAEEVMDIATNPGDADHLLQFLRTGRLPGEQVWSGVIGQSAGSPLFFVVRELRRLGVIPHRKVDASAFFVCTPVRRLAARLGWIDAKLSTSYDFQSLEESSRRIHAAAMKLPEKDSYIFRQWFDIPLLHYALNHP